MLAWLVQILERCIIMPHLRRPILEDSPIAAQKPEIFDHRRSCTIGHIDANLVQHFLRFQINADLLFFIGTCDFKFHDFAFGEDRLCIGGVENLTAPFPRACQFENDFIRALGQLRLPSQVHRDAGIFTGERQLQHTWILNHLRILAGTNL